jgi:hypothetical protein
MTTYLLLFDSYGLVFVVHPLWREDGSVFCICCWPLPAQSFSVLSPLGLAIMFYCLRLRLSFSSPPTTRRVTEEVFYPASTCVLINLSGKLSCYNVSANRVEVISFNSRVIAFLAVTVLLMVHCHGYWLLIKTLVTEVL